MGPLIPIFAAVLGAVAATTTALFLDRWLRKQDERGDEPVQLEQKSKSRGELPEPEAEQPPDAP